MIRITAYLILACVTTASAESLESVEKTISKKFQNYNALSAKLNMTLQAAPGMNGSSEGTMEFLRHDGKEKVRTETTTKMNYGGMSMQSHVLTIFDGEKAYMITEMMARRQVMRVSPNQMTGRAGGKAFFEDLKRQYVLRLLPDATVDGKATYVIQGTAKQPTQQGPSRSLYYFDKESGVLIKMLGRNQDDKIMMLMTLTNVKINPKLDPARFEYTPEPGTDVIDMTKQP